VLLIPSCLAGTISVHGPASVNEGGRFSVTIEGTDLTDLYAFQFDLSYDPALSEAKSSSEGEFLLSGGPTFFVPGTIDNIGGSVAFTANSLLSPVAGVSGSGILAIFQFNALSAGMSPLGLSNVLLLDSSLSDIAATTIGSWVEINGSSTVTTPEPSTMLVCLAGLGGLMWWTRRSTPR